MVLAEQVVMDQAEWVIQEVQAAQVATAAEQQVFV
tara:strand:+ start:398 stop:502 length:105 start_codon:yes stop_codon:yes gene_type:complete